jgi:hypothetical protein
MRASDFDKIQKDKFKPKLVARWWGGYNGNSIPPDVKPLFQKHVKTAANGKQYINQYDDRWYYSVFKNYPHITDWDSFFDVIKPYFTVQRKQDI